MSGELTRIFSDIHYGDRASRVRRLAQLRPLVDGVSALVLNGDTLDTRPGPAPAHTAACRAEVLAFFPQHVAHVTFLTGNHDPDLSPHHLLDLADGQVVVTHGDILFDNIVPWGRDGALLGRRIAEGLAALPPDARERLEERFAVWRRVAASTRQRHQSEPHSLKYAVQFAADTVWPPLRILRILDAWRHEPARAAAFARQYRPHAKFFIAGHVHRTVVQRTPTGLVALNTGSFCPPFGGSVVDLEPGRLRVRRVTLRGGEFRAGDPIAEFALADA